MARCEEGYRCAVCGADVERLSDSEIYLKYVIGELDPERLHIAPERHIRCNPVLAQFIEDPDFSPVEVTGPFARGGLDQAYREQRSRLLSAGYRRLRELEQQGGDRDVTSYPLPSVRARWGLAEETEA